MSRVHANNYITTLNGNISSGALSLIVTSATGFPTVGAGVIAYVTLQNGSAIEIVKVTAQSGTTLTIERAQEDTTAQAFVSGSTVSIRPTKGSFDGKADIASPTFTGTVVLPSTTSIGTVSATELSYVDGVTSSIQTQLDALAGGEVGAALTKTDDTNVTLTLTGSPTTALLHASNVAVGWSGQLGLTRGGTGNSLTASNGGIVYSDATDLEILSGTATAGLPLISGSSTSPTWGTLNGSGNIVATTSPALITPALGTVASGVISTCTSTSMVMITPILGTPTSGNISNCTSTSMVMVTPVLGTPTSGNLSNCTALSLTTGVSGTLPVGSGGTNVTSVTIAPAATAFAGWDANKNLSANSFIGGYRTTATGAGTTTLVVGDAQQQYFTGSTTQTCVLPVTSTLVLGQQYRIVNLSSGVVTVQSSGTNSVQAMAANTDLLVTVVSTSLTTAAAWDAIYSLANAGVLSITGTANQITASASTGNITLSVPNKFLVDSINIWQGLQRDGQSTAVGKTTLSSTNNASATDNSTFGYNAGNGITSGASNTCIGSGAGLSLTTAGTSTMVGFNAGTTTTGSNCCIVGASAAGGSANNTVIGTGAGTTGATGGTTISNSAGATDNTLLGYRATCDTNSSVGCIAIGEDAVALKATGALSSNAGPGISIGSAARLVGFRGDGSIYPGNLWRVRVNGTAYMIPLAVDASTSLPVANGGTNATSAGITAFNNITGYTAAGATGTTSTNLVFSTSPTLTTPIISGAISGVSGIQSSGGLDIVTYTAQASAVNYLNITSAVTTQPVYLKAVGADTNIGIQFNCKAAGPLQLVTTATTNQWQFYTGAHASFFNMPMSAASTSYTFPDATGTVQLQGQALPKVNGTEASNAVTANGYAGVITTSSLTTAASSSYAITWTNTSITATSVITLTIVGGTNTTQNVTFTCVPGSGSATLTIYNNVLITTALNGTILLAYQVL